MPIGLPNKTEAVWGLISENQVATKDFKEQQKELEE
jgi:hypothetical protein